MPHMRMDDGVELFYEELGEGERYVICSQVGHGMYSLEKQLAKRGFHVFLLTNRGFGHSTHVTEDYGDYWYDRFAQDVIAFADKKGIDRFVYSGASHGAGTGWHVALNAQHRLICFFAVVPGPHNLDEGKMSMRSMSMQGKGVEHCFRSPSTDEAVWLRRAQEDAAEAALRSAPDYENVFQSPETKAIDYGRPLRALQTEANVQAALKKIRVPVLIVGGMEDSVSRPDLMLRTAKCLPDCKLVIHAGFGHSLDIWEEVADDAVRFYQNVTQTGHYYSPLCNDLV